MDIVLEYNFNQVRNIVNDIDKSGIVYLKGLKKDYKYIEHRFKECMNQQIGIFIYIENDGKSIERNHNNVNGIARNKQHAKDYIHLVYQGNKTFKLVK